jgi:aminopeptidase N
MGNCHRLFPSDISSTENKLWKFILSEQTPQHRLQALRLYNNIAWSPEAIRNLYTIWKDQLPPDGCLLNETDYMSFSYGLAIRLPEQADAITAEQLSRISNPDRQQEYRFISPAVSPDKAKRNSVFHSLSIAENRRIEPWAAAALSWLNHSSRQEEAVVYIRPALDLLEEVQRTGDIFFPTKWVRALLSGHTSPEAKGKIERFFSENPAYPAMLSNKIKQQADFLYRANH